MSKDDHLDNDKDLRQEILYEFLNQFKEDKYLSQGNTDKAVGAIDQYTQSKLKAFAEEFEAAIGEDEPEPEIPVNDYYWRFRNELRAKQRKALKAIKEKYNV